MSILSEGWVGFLQKEALEWNNFEAILETVG